MTTCRGGVGGLEDRAGCAYCVTGLQEAVSELILPSTTGNLSLPDSICFKRISQVITACGAEGRAEAGAWNPWHCPLSYPGQGSFSLGGGQAEPRTGWGQGQAWHQVQPLRRGPVPSSPEKGLWILVGQSTILSRAVSDGVRTLPKWGRWLPVFEVPRGLLVHTTGFHFPRRLSGAAMFCKT